MGCGGVGLGRGGVRCDVVEQAGGWCVAWRDEVRVGWGELDWGCRCGR